MNLRGQFLRFCAVGATGFVIDVSVLYLMLHFGLGLYSARIISFLTAATATWLGNRRFTFPANGSRRRKLSGEWMTYVSAMGLGGLANYGTYALAVSFLTLFREQPWLAVAGGTGAGLLINFVLARRILFQPSG